MAVEATKTAEALHDLFQADRIKVESLGRAAPSAIKVYEMLKQRILVSPTKAAHVLELTWPTTIAALKRMEELGITTEVTGKKRDRLFVYSNQLRILDEGLGTSPSGGN